MKDREPSAGAKLLAAGIAVLACADLVAQRGTDIRAPQKSVFRAFPAANRYRTVVRKVDDRMRSEIEKRLPFKIHFDELGPHNLFVVSRDRRPAGLLYARTEEGDWGLAEIHWALTLDLRVHGFRLERCRSRHRPAIQKSNLLQTLTGRSVVGLQRLLDDEGRLAPDATDVPPAAREVATTIVRSSIKALVVARIVWGQEIEKLRDLQLGVDAFPRGVSFRRFVIDPRRPGAAPAGKLLLTSIRVVQARDGRARPLGYVVRTAGRFHAEPLALSWQLRPDLRIERVTPLAESPAAATRIACRRLAGTRPIEGPDGPHPLQRMAFELLHALHNLARSAR